MEALSCHACGGTFAGAAARAWSRVGLVVTVAATMGLACLAVMWRLHGGGH
ncbi:MAG TPA: hypothetical protein VGQ42_13125 [Candidatus Dormibacteraeota bacterium]|jgi:hypothetical protein|nr:hypothetical protein [Candidatus Dormibacteraeota bacterium]